MEITEHITTVGQEAKLFAEAAEQGGLDADATLAGVDGWIAKAAPDFQRIFEPVRFF